MKKIFAFIAVAIIAVTFTECGTSRSASLANFDGVAEGRSVISKSEAYQNALDDARAKINMEHNSNVSSTATTVYSDMNSNGKSKESRRGERVVNYVSNTQQGRLIVVREKYRREGRSYICTLKYIMEYDEVN